ncbi:sortase B protein-sorting domain-containing protein, partial [Bacillus sp. HC-Mk]
GAQDRWQKYLEKTGKITEGAVSLEEEGAKVESKETAKEVNKETKNENGKAEKTDNPKTGDEARIGLFAALILISGAFLIRKVNLSK